MKEAIPSPPVALLRLRSVAIPTQATMARLQEALLQAQAVVNPAQAVWVLVQEVVIPTQATVARLQKSLLNWSHKSGTLVTRRML